MIDPLLEGFDMPLLIDMPILPSQVPSLDAILITHIDNDHFSRMTCTDLKTVCNKYYAPNYVGDVMLEEGYPVQKCDIGDGFKVGSLDVKLTPAKHNWQNWFKKMAISFLARKRLLWLLVGYSRWDNLVTRRFSIIGKSFTYETTQCYFV